MDTPCLSLRIHSQLPGRPHHPKHHPTQHRRNQRPTNPNLRHRKQSNPTIRQGPDLRLLRRKLKNKAQTH